MANKLEHAKKQCFAYHKMYGCTILTNDVKSCKGCRFYKTAPQFEKDAARAQMITTQRRKLAC